MKIITRKNKFYGCFLGTTTDHLVGLEVKNQCEDIDLSIQEIKAILALRGLSIAIKPMRGMVRHKGKVVKKWKPTWGVVCYKEFVLAAFNTKTRINLGICVGTSLRKTISLSYVGALEVLSKFKNL